MQPCGVFQTIGKVSYIVVRTKNSFFNQDDYFILVPLDEIELRRFPNRDLQVIPPWDDFICITPQTIEEREYILYLSETLPLQLSQYPEFDIWAENNHVKSKDTEYKNRRNENPA